MAGSGAARFPTSRRRDRKVSMNSTAQQGQQQCEQVMRRVVPPLWLLLWSAFQHALVWASGGRRRFAGQRLATTAVSAGAILLAVGAERQFARAGTTFRPEDPSRATALVGDGVFAYTRNPMYLGMCGLLVAQAVWTGRLRALVAIPGFIACLTPQVRAEEHALAELFGADYAAYLTRVPRWIVTPSGHR